MESTNLHYLQDQPPPPPGESSSLSTSSSFGVLGGTTTHSYNTLNAGNLNQYLQEANPRPRSSTPKNDINNSMIQDLGYHHHHHHQWTSTDAAENCLNNSMKEEISVAGFPKFSEMLNSSTASSNMGGYRPAPTSSTTTQTKNNINEHKDMNTLMLKTLFTPNFYSTNDQNYPNFGSTSTRGNFSSQIYPSINISNMNQNHSSACTALDLSMPSLDLDLLTSPPISFTAGLNHRHSQDHHHLARFTDNNLSFNLHHMQHPADRSSCSNSSNPSLFTNGTAETKRPCTLIESKASQSQTALKKSRSSESRTSCPPFKVRKEKLGDRIAALQQLVAPFGKTDTASVLMEAIGYIKFLQGQVETLSVPYMKPSQNQTNRVMQVGSATDGEPKQDLRSRGLCLMPLSCMSYLAGDGGSDVWQQQPNFGRPI